MSNSVITPVLMVFAKAPLPGTVKTRLAKDLGNINAANIYKKMLYDFLVTVTGRSSLRVQLWCYPDTHHPFFSRCARDFNVPLHRQSGADLGLRMLYAFKYNKKQGAMAMVLAGTDIPSMSIDDINLAIHYLHTQADVVLTPTLDGGYGLIAMKQASSVVFNNMKWSTPVVLEKTLQRLLKRQYKVKLLEYKRDIDDRQDYRYYRRSVE